MGSSFPPSLPPRAVITTNKTTTKAAADRRLQARVFDYQENEHKHSTFRTFSVLSIFFFHNTFLLSVSFPLFAIVFWPTTFFLSMFTLLYECVLRLSCSFFHFNLPPPLPLLVPQSILLPTLSLSFSFLSPSPISLSLRLSVFIWTANSSLQFLSRILLCISV